MSGASEPTCLYGASGSAAGVLEFVLELPELETGTYVTPREPCA